MAKRVTSDLKVWLYIVFLRFNEGFFAVREKLIFLRANSFIFVGITNYLLGMDSK